MHEGAFCQKNIAFFSPKAIDYTWIVMNLVLASSSPYRRKILEQLRLPFSTCSPDIDESPKSNENIDQYVSRLALQKAHAVADRFPDSLIIGSDQACHLGGMPLGKPENLEAALKHLKLCSGTTVEFLTGLALLNTASGHEQVTTERFRVTFRHLTDDEIRAYIQLDQPLDCAGSFKVEAAGISLFTAMEGRDYNTLLGLPMLALVDMLKTEGVNPLLAAAKG